jgi:RNA-splicing ligase RtcB
MTILVNLSHEPDWRLRSWLEQARALAGATVAVCLPDACPGRSPLPTGTGLKTKAADWRRLAVSDVGCGICIVRSRLRVGDASCEDFRKAWRALCEELRANRNRGLGDLGSGNHFLDAVVSGTDQSVAFVVHTGSRQESGLVDDLIDSPGVFEREFRRIEAWARDNRGRVLEHVERRFGPFIPLGHGVDRLDRNHNHFEDTGEGIIIRKGSQRVRPGELAIIPSNLMDDMALVRALPAVQEILDCLPHGTGRAMSRSAAKAAGSDGLLADLRSRVFIPESIEDASLRTETPSCYRPLDPCLERIADYAQVVERFTPVAYIGQL